MASPYSPVKFFHRGEDNCNQEVPAPSGCGDFIFPRLIKKLIQPCGIGKAGRANLHQLIPSIFLEEPDSFTGSGFGVLGVLVKEGVIRVVGWFF